METPLADSALSGSFYSHRWAYSASHERRLQWRLYSFLFVPWKALHECAQNGHRTTYSSIHH